MRDHPPTDRTVRLFDRLRAGYCHRWAANPELAGTEETDSHQARVVKIILFFWPDARAALLAAAVQHDDGEMGLGDVAGPAKRAHPIMAETLDLIEAERRADLGLPEYHLRPWEELVLHLSDKLAGFMHVQQVRPWVLAHADWQHDLYTFRLRLALAARDNDALLSGGAGFAAMKAAFLREFPFVQPEGVHDAG